MMISRRFSWFLMMFMFLGLGLSTGCASVDSFDSGVSSRNAPQIFYHLRKEAKARGYNVYEEHLNDNDDNLQRTPDLSVSINRGSMRYGAQGSQIRITVQASDAFSLSDEQVEQRVDSLRVLSTDLLDAAQKRVAARRNAEQRGSCDCSHHTHEHTHEHTHDTVPAHTH